MEGSKNNDTPSDTAASLPKAKSLVVVVRKRKKHSKTTKAQPFKSGRSTISKPTITKIHTSKGLPTFSRQSNTAIISKPTSTTTSVPQTDADEDPLFQDADPLTLTDTYMALQFLMSSSQGLALPFKGGGPSKEVVLESQIYRRLAKTANPSSVQYELQALRQAKRLCVLTGPKTTRGSTTSLPLILTKDYLDGVWDAAHHNAHGIGSSTTTTTMPSNTYDHHQLLEIVEWFVDGVTHHWAGTATIGRDVMEDHYETAYSNYKRTPGKAPCLDVCLQKLIQLQVLIQDATSSPNRPVYRLWLPQWGLVLQAWTKAQTQLLSFLARKKELSEANLLRVNQHKAVSTKFVLDDLLHQGRVRLVERPFGKFYQRVP